MLGREVASLASAPGADDLRPLDEPADLAEVVVEEDKDGDRAELTAVQVVVYQVGMLVAQEDTHVELPALGGEPAKNGQVVDDIAAPVFGEYEHVERARQTLERCGIGGVERQVALVRRQTLL